jgi:exodeoxyribonuclease VII small subunit
MRDMEELSALVGKLERGDLPLEEALAEYERGMGLLKECRAFLARTEQRILQAEPDPEENGPEGTEPWDEEDGE